MAFQAVLTAWTLMYGLCNTHFTHAQDMIVPSYWFCNTLAQFTEQETKGKRMSDGFGMMSLK